MTTTEKNKNVPELRFPDFEGEWVDKKLGDFASFNKGKGISKNEIVPDGKSECIRYGELYTHYSEVIDNIKSKTNVDIKKLVLSEKNDVIIPASGETQIDIATASCVLKKGVALGGDLNIIKSSLNGVFLSYYLNNKKKKDIASLAQGNSIVHLYSNQLKTLDINVPVEYEQQKIATFLTAVDKRIHMLTQKKENLEQYKKGVMQKLFSRALRFKDDNGNEFSEWEEKRLGEICEKQSSNISANSLDGNKGAYEIYGATGHLQNVDFYREEHPYISIVKDGAGVGRVLLCEGKSSVLGTLDIIKAKTGNHLEFLFSILSRINFKKYMIGSTIPHIYFKDYSKEKILMPSLQEQQKIASFLSTIDKQIEQVARQIEHSNQWKKGLLQKMFV